MSETTVVTVSEIVEKAGETNGKPWTRYAIKDGNGIFYSTFNADVIAPARDRKGQQVEITFEQKDKFKNLEAVKIPDAASPIAARTEDGAADWDLIGLRKTRCLLWAHYLGNPETLKLVMNMASVTHHDAEQMTPSRAALELYKFGSLLVERAEADIYQRKPPEDGSEIPF